MKNQESKSYNVNYSSAIT